MRFRSPPEFRGLYARTNLTPAIADEVVVWAAFIEISRRSARTIAIGFFSLIIIALLLSSQPLRAETGVPEGKLTPWAEGAKPVFSLESLDGRVLKLADYRDRVVLVHFFATWCDACQREMASLRRLASRLPARKVAIVAISVNEVDIRVRRFFERTPVNFPIALDRDGAVAKAWRVDELPATFVLDPNLEPKYFVDGDLDWDRPEVDRALSQLWKQATLKNPPKASGS